jgi:ABC-type bacteriocin/lantibiotic exporter with double-glycine peptidase domain
MILMAWVDYRIVVAMIILGTPTLLFYYFFKKYWIRKIDDSFRKLTPEANMTLTQGIESYSEARIYHSESYFIKTFLNISSKTSNLLGKLKVLSTLPARIMEIAGIICFVSVVFFGTETLTSSDTVLMLGLLSLAIYRIMPSFNRMISSLTQIQSYAYSAEEIFNITKIKISSPAISSGRLSFKHSIHLNHIAFAYEQSQRKLFRDLNVTIDKGEFVILTGHSGSGKTTLIHMLAGLIQPTKGSILVDDHRLSNANISQWQNGLGYVPQAGVIHNESILNNILFTKSSVHQDNLDAALQITGLADLIADLPDGINTKVGEHGMSLSGGQRQRLILARAIYRDPDILLLDEVTNQLDENAKLDILKRLKRLTQKGVTIILSSHDSAVKSFATKEIVLGREVENTTSVFQ